MRFGQMRPQPSALDGSAPEAELLRKSLGIGHFSRTIRVTATKLVRPLWRRLRGSRRRLQFWGQTIQLRNQEEALQKVKKEAWGRGSILVCNLSRRLHRGSNCAKWILLQCCRKNPGSRTNWHKHGKIRSLARPRWSCPSRV